MPGESIGRLQRIESSESQLQEGTAVIVEGAHYVQEGDQVRLVEEVEAQP